MLRSTCVAPNARYMQGKRLRRESLSVKFAGLDIADRFSRRDPRRLGEIMHPYVTDANAKLAKDHPEKVEVIRRDSHDLCGRLTSSWTLDSAISPWSAARRHFRPESCNGCGWRRRFIRICLACVYVLDEPSAGLHPADTEALLRALDRLKASG